MTRRSSAIFLAAVALSAWLGLPAAVEAQQCSVIGSSAGTMPPIFVAKTVSNTMCQLTMFNNANCFPGGAYPTVVLGAMSTSAAGVMLTATQVTQPSTLSNPSCGWACSMSSCTVTIGTQDGLPVELMEFGVGDGDSAESAGSEPTS